MEDLILTAPASALTAFAEPNGLDPFIDAVRKIVSEFEHDLSTGAGRKKTASLAAKVSSFKVSMDEMGKSLTEDWKNKSKVVDQTRKKMRDELDALRDEARRPLTEWEDKEKARVATIRAKIEDLRNYAVGFETVEDLERRLTALEVATEIDDSFEEFKLEAIETRCASIDILKSNLAKAKLAESQRLELELLRAEAEARAKADREESLRKEGELRAQREAESKLKAEQERMEAQKQFAIKEAERKELDARRLAEFNAKALRDAEERARMAEENAKRKAEAEARAIEEEKARREANAAHNKKIKSQAKACLISLGLDEQTAIKVIIAIDENKVKNIRIEY